MSVVVRALRFLLICAFVLSASSALAQLPIDPSVLAQLTPDQKQQLLSGTSSAGGTSNSSDSQDSSLQNPAIISNNSSSSSGKAYGNGDNGINGDSRSSRLGSGYGDGSVRCDPQAYLVPCDSSDSSVDCNSQQGSKEDPRCASKDARIKGGLADISDRQRRLDSDFSMQRGKPVRPFGYDLFSGMPNTFAPVTDIPVPSDYVIGPGDNIRVQLFGNQNQTFTLLVSRDGTINFPKLGPITVVGMRFELLQSMIESRISKELIGTTASVTLGRLRSVQVFVLGDVSHPGAYTVSSLSTMTHALFVSGGISEVGSLRRVELKRAGVVVSTLDLYRFLLGGDSSHDVRLQPGDVVFVPPVGARVTIEGEVKRPAIYELNGESSLADVVALSGGRLATSDQTYVEMERITANGKREVLNFDLAKVADLKAPVRDGDLVRVRKIAKQLENEIRVMGAVKYPGVYPWTENRTIKSVLDEAGVLESDARAETYLPLGVIERTDKTNGIRTFLSFNVATVRAASSPTLELEPNDLVIVFGREDIAFLSSFDVEQVLSGKVDEASAEYCPALTELRSIVNSQRAVRFLRALSSESVRIQKAIRPRQACTEIFRAVPRVLPYLLDTSVGIYGEVTHPGVYPVSAGTSLQLLLDAVGGATNESDPKNVEYVSFLGSVATGQSKYQTLNIALPDTLAMSVASGDIFNLRPIFLDQEIGSVRLMGEVRFPGSYSLIRGETLSHVIARAGGLINGAYTYGAVLTRESARQAEAASFKRAASDLQEAVVTVISSGTLTGDTSSVTTFMDSVIKRLSAAEPVGRVVVEADPVVLKVRPELDFVMEAGDVLMIPKRPTSITVTGQVLNPGSQFFVAGRAAEDYIAGAGGISEGGDKKRAFIVFPNGEARALKLSAWNFQKQDVPPGSLIIVPRDAAPLNKLLLTERVLSIFSNLAISAAALVTISNH